MTRSDKHVVEQVAAGVDWLTLTLPWDAEQIDLWHMTGMRALGQVSAGGYELKPRSMLGYDGQSCGNCFVGTRCDGIMQQFTGHHADTAISSVYRQDAHISRVDLQVTVKFASMPSDIARKAYTSANAANRRLPSHRHRKLYIIVGSDGGDTFYLGSPASSQRGRLYNKEIQSEDPVYARMWRYEVVYRNDRAQVVTAAICPGSENRAATIRNTVAEWWKARGVDCSYFATGAGAVVPLYRTLPTDIERKLIWLRSQVRPTVKLLLELGMQDELAAALDLPVLNSADNGAGGPIQ